MNNSQLPCKPASLQLSYVIVHIPNLILDLFKIISFEVCTPNRINSTLLKISMIILFLLQSCGCTLVWTTTDDLVDLANHYVIKPLLAKQLTILGKLLHSVWNHLYGISINSTKVVNWFLQPISNFSHLCIFYFYITENDQTLFIAIGAGCGGLIIAIVVLVIVIKRFALFNLRYIYFF